MLFSPPNEARQKAAAYDFRKFSPATRFGTASDRYAGWIGQIYPDTFEPEISSRNRKLGGKSYQERTLPIHSVVDYFEHFEVLEIDFTYYRPLLNPDLTPSSNSFVLEQYASAAPDNARFLLKAPQQFFTRTLRRSSGGKTLYTENEDFLNAKSYIEQFIEPAKNILGDRLEGIILEQSYQRVADSPPIEQHIVELDGFFKNLPNDVQSHLEIRSPHLLTPPYFSWLESNGLGFVFSHWTWLPPLRDQWQRCNQLFSAADRNVIVRLLTPLRLSYAKAYEQAYPFDKAVEAIVNSKGGHDMILDVTALAFQAKKQDAVLNVIANNRAWGNSPALAQAVAHRIIDHTEKQAD
ncbi:MAG: DUF72 domain-containing protein [Rhodothermales bacterium]